MPTPKSDPMESTYPLRTVARLTGLSPELLRAWERRYAIVEPLRTPGGTRRYTAEDLERLRLVKAAVDAGHRISHVAKWDPAELERRSAIENEISSSCVEEILTTLERLDSSELQRLLALQLSVLGPATFAREVASPLVTEIGERWSHGRLGIAQEHLATGVLRSLLGSALQPTAASRVGPRVLFATPVGERHELGLLMAALSGLSAGSNTLYLGTDLPVEEILAAVEMSDAVAVALSIVTIPRPQAVRFIDALRGGLASHIHVWVGGIGSVDLELPDGVEYIDGLEALERRVMLLGFANSSTP